MQLRIATEAQVSVGLLYRFFDSKSAMVKAIILEDIGAQLEQAGSAIASGAAIHAMLYSSGSPEASMKLISKLISGA